MDKVTKISNNNTSICGPFYCLCKLLLGNIFNDTNRNGKLLLFYNLWVSTCNDEWLVLLLDTKGSLCGTWIAGGGGGGGGGGGSGGEGRRAIGGATVVPWQPEHLDSGDNYMHRWKHNKGKDTMLWTVLWYITIIIVILKPTIIFECKLLNHCGFLFAFSLPRTNNKDIMISYV